MYLSAVPRPDAPNVVDRVVTWLGRTTAPRRERAAASVFLVGSAPLADRLAASLYFGLAARRWGRHTESTHHVAAFADGLGRCAPPTAVLDLGTGAGASAAAVAARYPAASVTGVDTSRAMLREATRRHRLANLAFRRGDVTRLPFADGSFDLVTVLNAVAEPQELRRVTRPGAELLLATTFLDPRPDDSVWVARWRELGFARQATGAVEGGSWELYRRDG